MYNKLFLDLFLVVRREDGCPLIDVWKLRSVLELKLVLSIFFLRFFIYSF